MTLFHPRISLPKMLPSLDAVISSLIVTNDAAGELYDMFMEKGCMVFGFTSTDGYDHVQSKAERDGKFVGVMFDEDNQYDLSEDHSMAWVSQLTDERFFQAFSLSVGFRNHT